MPWADRASTPIGAWAACHRFQFALGECSHTSSFLSARWTSGEVAGLSSRRGWVRIPHGSFSFAVAHSHVPLTERPRYQLPTLARRIRFPQGTLPRRAAFGTRRGVSLRDRPTVGCDALNVEMVVRLPLPQLGEQFHVPLTERPRCQPSKLGKAGSIPAGHSAAMGRVWPPARPFTAGSSNGRTRRFKRRDGGSNPPPATCHDVHVPWIENRDSPLPTLANRVSHPQGTRPRRAASGTRRGLSLRGRLTAGCDALNVGMVVRLHLPQLGTTTIEGPLHRGPPT